MTDTIPTQCPYCQSSIRYIKAGVSKRTGKPYNEFWACENRDCKFTWHPNKKPQPRRPEQPTRDQIIMAELQGLNERLDAIETNWAEKLEGIRKAFKEVLEKLK